jgi:glycosyltransferase involved in cell wall biosynthesis
MRRPNRPIRVLQTFPHKIGAGRICDTAWHQAVGVAGAGGDVLVMPASVHRALPSNLRVRPTLARGRLRVPYTLVGRMRALKLHDRLVAAALPKLASQIDIVHAWPSGALETLRIARSLGIPTVLERPNAHTRFAYRVVREESERLGLSLPPDHEHAYNADVLTREEQEFALADRLLCPADFVVKTFRDEGFANEKLVRTLYGYEDGLFHPPEEPRRRDRGLTVLFVGVCAVRKGVHYGLEAWLRSPASRSGTFLIAGEFLPEYADRLSGMLAHPSVQVLGHRTDVPELLRRSDALVLPSIEEGSALVCGEAVASGCVPLVSDASSAVCEHGKNSLVHSVADVSTLADHFTTLHENRQLLEQLREGCLRTAPGYTWAKAGVRLLDVYEEVVASEVGKAVSRAA